MDRKPNLTIGTISRLSGLSAKSIRYYEEIGLVMVPCRSEAGYRQYTDDHLHILTFIRRARDLGFSLSEASGLLQLWKDNSRSSAEIKALAAMRLTEMDRKLAELESMKCVLGELVASCADDKRPDCPILDGLADTRH